MNHHEKTHFFRDDDDNRLDVVTRILPDGSYEAELNEPSRLLFGYGATHLEAIANLQEHIDLDASQ